MSVDATKITNSVFQNNISLKNKLNDPVSANSAPSCVSISSADVDSKVSDKFIKEAAPFTKISVSDKFIEDSSSFMQVSVSDKLGQETSCLSFSSLCALYSCIVTSRLVVYGCSTICRELEFLSKLKSVESLKSHGINWSDFAVCVLEKCSAFIGYIKGVDQNCARDQFGEEDSLGTQSIFADDSNLYNNEDAEFVNRGKTRIMFYKLLSDFSTLKY